MASPSEGLPAGLTPAAASTAAATGPEPPQARRRHGVDALSLSARLLAGASTFFFLAFLFAYFYLRSINQDHMWRPAHIKPDQALGAGFIACVLLSVALTILAGRREKRGAAGWTTPAGAGVALGLVAIVLQCIEYTTQNFGPTNGAFASVFCAWSGFYLLAVLGTMYWLQTQVATELYARRPSVATQLAPGADEDPDELLPRGLDAAVFYWGFLGGIGLLTYVTLYLL